MYRRRKPRKSPTIAEQAAQLARQVNARKTSDPEQPWIAIEWYAERYARAVEAEQRALAELEEAQQRYNDAAWAFHDAVQKAKAEVLAQFGVDSPQYQSVAGNRRARRRIARRRAKESAS